MNLFVILYFISVRGIIIFMNKKAIFCVIFLFGVQISAPIFASELSDDYFDIANNYYTSNNYAKSLEYLDLVLQIEPDNQSAKNLRDKLSPPVVKAQSTAVPSVLSTVNNLENIVILSVPQADIEKMAYDSNYYNQKGQELYQKKDYDTAIEYFYKSINYNKNNAQAYNNLGMAYWSKNNTGVAIKYFKQANYIDNKFTQPLVNLAMLYKQLGKVDKQVYYLKKAIRYNTCDYSAYFHLGEYYKNQGCYSDAIKNFKYAVKINPKYSPAYLNLAICYYELQEYNYSQLALSQYNDLCNESDFVLYFSAKLDEAMCNFVSAKTKIDKAIAICDKSEYRLELGKIDYSLEDYQSALGIFQGLLKDNCSAENFNYVGLCNYMLKNLEIAIENFNKAVEIDGLRPIYYYNLAQCYKALKDQNNYVKYYNSAVGINPINYQDYLDLSCINFENSNQTGAINFLDAAIVKYPCSKELYLQKLKIYESIGDNLNYNKTNEVIKERFKE